VCDDAMEALWAGNRMLAVHLAKKKSREIRHQQNV